MIVVDNKIVNASFVNDEDKNDPLAQDILRTLMRSKDSNIYKSNRELSFDISLRKSIVNASKLMSVSGMQFQTFRRAYCNPMFWIRTPQGGFLVRPGVRPSDAINDIFRFGRFYATECATAIIIIFYKALLDLYGYNVFDQLFDGIYLFTWNYDSNLAVKSTDIDIASPGDVVYFKNPQVDPFTPEWQGENTVVMGNNYYFGHGIGIKSSQEIIFHLNHHRFPFAMISAFLTKLTTRIDANEMAKHLIGDFKLTPVNTKAISSDVITASIGDQNQIA